MRQNDFNSPTEKSVGLFVAFFGDVILEQRVTDAKSKLLQSIRNNVHKSVEFI